MKTSAWLTPLFILLFIAFATAFPDVANAVAKFDYSDLILSEHFVQANEEDFGEITATVTVTNSGDESGAHVVQLKINGVLESSKDITLDSGAQQKIIFTVSKPAGEYELTIGTLEDSFTVAPSNLKIENLIIDPVEAKEGQSVVISVTALNTSAEKTLDFDALKLLINGEVVASKAVKLKEADSTKVSFTTSRDVPGDYVVQIGPKTGSFTVTASFWSSFPPYMWAIFGAVAGVLVMLIIVLFLTAPRRRGKSATPRIKKGAKEPSIPVSQPAAKTPFLSPSEPAKPPMMPVPAPGPGPARSPVPSPAPYPAQSAQPKPAQSYPTQPMQVPPGIPRPPAPSSPTMHTPPPPHPVTPSLPRVIPQPQPNMRPNAAPPPRVIPPQPTPVPPPVHTPKVEPPSMPHVTPTPFAMPAKTTPLFSVGNLTITPNQIKEGDPVTITAVVTNSGTATGQYSMVLRIGSVVENIAELTLNPGERQTATFSVVKDIAGDYHVEVDGLRGIFTVIPRLPASFTISNLTITPERVKQGETVNVSAIVANTGETEGSYSVVLRIKGIAERIEEITLPPGKNQRVVFNITKDAAGFYPIALENLSGRFVVEMDWT